jgi:hypothetical protein
MPGLYPQQLLEDCPAAARDLVRALGCPNEALDQAEEGLLQEQAAL